MAVRDGCRFRIRRVHALNRLATIRNRYWQTGFFLAVVAVAVWGVRHDQGNVNRKIVASQLNACERGGVLRAQVNYDTDLIRTFMLEAVKATRAKKGKQDKVRAASYQRLANGLLDVSQPTCGVVIYHPK